MDTCHILLLPFFRGCVRQVTGCGTLFTCHLIINATCPIGVVHLMRTYFFFIDNAEVLVASITPASLIFNLIASRVKLMNYLTYFEGDIILYYNHYKENK